MAASIEDVALGVGIFSGNFEEDAEEESTHVCNEEYDSIGAGGSDNDDPVQSVQENIRSITFYPPLEYLTESRQSISLHLQQYRLLLQKSIVFSPLYILYCCPKGAIFS